MEKINVLLVEDEQALAMIIRDTLEGEGFLIRTAADGEEGLRLIASQRPDVVVADVMMPHMDGFEMVRRLRRADRQTPVLFLTARTATQDVVEGFELGANDYLRKPFGMQELIVRIKALTGRAFCTDRPAAPADTLYRIGAYAFDPRNQRLCYCPDAPDAVQQAQTLSHRESEILLRLCRAGEQVVEMRPLLLDLWGNDDYFCTRSLHVFITKLRRHLSRDNRIRIINVRGIGYKLIC